MRYKQVIFYARGLKATGKLDAKSYSTQMIPNMQLTTNDGELFSDLEIYWRLVGQLNYLIVTHPDIAYQVSILRQFMFSARTTHWVTLEHLCCLKETPGCGILCSNHGHSCIECFSDTNWADSKIDRRSTTGYCIFIRVIWYMEKSKAKCSISL